MSENTKKQTGIKVKPAFEDQVVTIGGKKVVTIHSAFLKQMGIADPNRDQMRTLLEELSKLFASNDMEGGSDGTQS